MRRYKLYGLLSTACAAGYIWLAITYHQQVTKSMEAGVCIFKYITHVPCPSCGSTRSVLSLMNGNLLDALLWNPFGILLMTILVVSPFWILYDLVSRKSTLLNVYIKTELLLKRQWITVPAVLIVVMNWIWNISKGL